MSLSIIRFWSNGWIHEMYIAPTLFFPYYGFEWVTALPGNGMYVVFFVMLLSAMGIALGLFYRWTSISFFVLFTYVELIDKTNYLNHYYFVSLIAFLMCLLPAAEAFSIDNWRKKRTSRSHIPNYHLWTIKGQLAILYFMAGVAKINSAWLFNAQPLKLWLPAHAHLPIIGGLLTKTWVAFVFSWFGCLYDLVIPFVLAAKRLVYFGFIAVVVFHMLTWLLFPIGMFPFIMICATTIFFPERFHRKVLTLMRRPFKSMGKTMVVRVRPQATSFGIVVPALLGVYFAFQLLLPFRYALYPGNLFWNEEGYRFSWRVMLMEKAGSAYFYVNLPNGAKVEIDNSQFLTPNQEKMMATQPDMMLQYAHWLRGHYEALGYSNIKITSDAYVTLNGERSRRFVDPEVNLAELPYNLSHRSWVIPYKKRR